MAGNSELKQNIIDQAKILFYENGYTNTTFRQIAKEMNISPGSISYHFQSKTEIGNIIYIGYMTEYYKNPVMKFLYDKYGSYDPRLAAAMEMRIQFLVYRDDRRVFNFYSELFNSQSFLSTNVSMASLTLLNGDLEKTNADSMKSVAAKGASVALTTAFFEGHLNVSFDEFADYKVFTVLRLTGCKDDVARRYVKSSKEIVNKLKITIKPYFEIDIKHN